MGQASLPLVARFSVNYQSVLALNVFVKSPIDLGKLRT
jgi:hypothetical protein